MRFRGRALNFEPSVHETWQVCIKAGLGRDQDSNLDTIHYSYLVACGRLEVLGDGASFWDHIGVGESGSLRIEAVKVFGGRMEHRIVLGHKLIPNLHSRMQQISVIAS